MTQAVTRPVTQPVTQPVTDLPSPTDPAAALAAVVALRRLAGGLERAAVDEAISAGWTWAQVGQALGISAQAAHKKLAPPREPGSPRLRTSMLRRDS